MHTFQPFRMTAGSPARSMAASEFQATPNGDQIFVWMLNEHLYRHLKSRGLAIDKKRKRAYFTRTESGERPIPYQARLRRATRVVTKPVVSPTTQRIRYWEHKAFYFSFEQFADTWMLLILPTYVFTKDGKYDLLQSDRVTALSTHRASRDYNNHVHNDLVFWTWVISGGDVGTFTLDPVSDGTAYPARTDKKPLTTKLKRPRGESVESIMADSAEAPQIVLSSSLATSLVSSPPEPDPDVIPIEAESDEFPDIEEELSRIVETSTSEAESAR